MQHWSKPICSGQEQAKSSASVDSSETPSWLV
jgi:hypothetical protein